MPQWTWEYLDDQMTVPRLKAYQKAWEHSPPLALAYARRIGIKPRPTIKTVDDMYAALAGLGLFQEAKPRRKRLPT